MKKRVISLKVLPGEPVDGTGRICIHLFVPDERGPFVETHCLYVDDERKIGAKLTRGRLACDPKRTVSLKPVNGVTTVTLRSDDPRAVTCPKCIASAEYIRKTEQLTATPVGK